VGRAFTVSNQFIESGAGCSRSYFRFAADGPPAGGGDGRAMIADVGAPQIVIVELVEDCRGRPDCAVRAERPADAQAEDEIRRAGQSSLPEGGPSALQSDQLPSRYAPAHDVTSLYDKDGWKLRWYFQGGLNLVSETNLFWDFASVYAPDAKFNSDQTWLEGYVKPGIGFDKTFADGNVFYGKLSGVAESADRDRELANRLRIRCIGQLLFEHRRHDRPRSQGVESDPGPGPLFRHRVATHPPTERDL
jgi:hypothetical protein